MEQNDTLLPGQLTIDGIELRSPTNLERGWYPSICPNALIEKGYFCVCAFTTVCECHGRQHHGTHD